MAKKDPIVEQVRKIRDRHAKSHAYDLKRIFRDLKNKEVDEKRELVNLSPKRVVRKTGT